MEEGNKFGLGLAFALGASYAVYKGIKYYLINRKLEFEIMPIPSKVTGGGLEIILEIKVNNPTRYSFTIKQPEVTLFHLNKEFVKSQASEKEYKIPANSSVQLSPVSINLSYVKLFTTFPSLVADLRNQGKMEAIAVVETQMDKFLPAIERIIPIGFRPKRI